jgi:hypothetical protein
MPNNTRPGADRLVERGDQPADVGHRADPPRQRRGDDVADEFMARRRQQSRGGDGPGHGAGALVPGDAADLHIAPRRQFERARAPSGGRVRQRLQLRGGDHPAR